MNTRKTRLILHALFFFMLSHYSPYVFANEETPAEEGFIIINVHAHLSTSPLSEGHAGGVWLRNLKTGKTYGSAHDTLLLESVPEGIYCVYEIELFPRGMGYVPYCGEPYFKVARGRLNNLGQWHFEVNQRLGEVRLEKSLEDLENTLKQAKKKYPEYFQ